MIWILIGTLLSVLAVLFVVGGNRWHRRGGDGSESR